MFSDDFDPSAPEIKERGVEMYAQNDSYFRQLFTMEEYTSLPRMGFDAIGSDAAYRAYVQHLPHVVFIDMGDVAKYLHSSQQVGLGVLDVSHVAEIVTEFLGAEDSLCDVLWSSFETEIVSELQAALGVEADDDNGSLIIGPPYDNAVAILFEVANVIQRYLVKARFPLVEMSSVYGVHNYQNGIVMLKLRQWADFEAAYRGGL